MSTPTNTALQDLKNIPTLHAQNTAEDEEKSLKEIMRNVTKAVEFTGTLQEFVHNKILIPAVIHAWKFKNAKVIKHVLDGLLPAHKTIRVESIAYWLTDYAGFRVEFKEKDSVYHVRMNYMGTSPSPLAHRYTYDADHLNNILKNPVYRYWKVAPVKIQTLRISNDVDKLFDGVEKRLAVAMLAGELDEEAIVARTNKIIDKIKQNMQDQKLIDKAHDYLEQKEQKEKEEAKKKAASQ